MTRDQIVLELQQEYAARREENQQVFEERIADACKKCPGLSELLSARRETLLSGIRKGILSDIKEPSANEGLSNVFSLYNEKIAALLKESCLPADALQPVYTCALCRDEGYLYEPVRHMCNCFEALLNQRMLEALGLSGANPQTFENFDETIFSDEPDPALGKSQRQVALLHRNTCLEYADAFPVTPIRDLLLMGKSGLGKTYLLQSIAHRVTEKGILPLYTSAYRLLETARRAYFENNSSLMSSLMEAPLLLIDDLGTEPLMANITVTQLFNLLNERQSAGRHTVISTNLDIPTLKERYTERITSRLLDSRNCRRMVFIGDDLRKRLAGTGEKP